MCERGTEKGREGLCSLLVTWEVLALYEVCGRQVKPLSNPTVGSHNTLYIERNVPDRM
jgi:hypothetical protein